MALQGSLGGIFGHNGRSNYPRNPLSNSRGGGRGKGKLLPAGEEGGWKRGSLDHDALKGWWDDAGSMEVETFPFTSALVRSSYYSSLNSHPFWLKEIGLLGRVPSGSWLTLPRSKNRSMSSASTIEVTVPAGKTFENPRRHSKAYQWIMELLDEADQALKSSVGACRPSANTGKVYVEVQSEESVDEIAHVLGQTVAVKIHSQERQQSHLDAVTDRKRKTEEQTSNLPKANDMMSLLSGAQSLYAVAGGGSSRSSRKFAKKVVKTASRSFALASSGMKAKADSDDSEGE